MTELGLKLAAAPSGNPLMLKLMKPVKPFVGDVLTDKVALLPGTMPTELVEGVIPKSGITPKPLSAIACGDPDALSTTEMEPGREPGADGAKTILIEQLAPAATEVPQLFVCVKSPLAVIEMIFNAAVPVLLR